MKRLHLIIYYYFSGNASMSISIALFFATPANHLADDLGVLLPVSISNE
jgi:hypothetical protein